MASQAGLNHSGGFLALRRDPDVEFRYLPPLSWKYAAAQLSSLLDLCLAVPLGNASTITAARAAAETMPFRRGCGSSDGSPFQEFSCRSPRPWIRPSILLDSSVSRAVTTVFSGPDLALETVSYVRRSHCSAPLDRLVPRPCSSFVDTVVRDDRSPQIRSPGAMRVALLPQH